MKPTPRTRTTTRDEATLDPIQFAIVKALVAVIVREISDDLDTEQQPRRAGAGADFPTKARGRSSG
jgi:hypothetical protein